MLVDNMRRAYRNLRSAPGFAATSILSLGIGIGGSVSMFTLVNSALLKPLAHPDSGRLVRVTNAYTAAYASSGKNADGPGLLPLQFLHVSDRDRPAGAAGGRVYIRRILPFDSTRRDSAES